MKKSVCLCCVLIIVCLLCLPNQYCWGSPDVREEILYNISPLGKAGFYDLGRVNFEGAVLNLIVFEVRVFGFSDTERIYNDPVSRLPVRVERDIRGWMGREKILEEYDQQNFRLTIKKYAGRRLQEQTIQREGPIHNAILLPFSIRQEPEIQPGWSQKIILPLLDFTIKMVSVEEIHIPAGVFSAFYFTGEPAKFKIWISNDDWRIPLKIKGRGYTMVLREHILPLEPLLKE